MSFTAEVKDELSRVTVDDLDAQYAQLSAIMRICGTLTMRGAHTFTLWLSTETGVVARTMIKLTHELFDLETPLTIRRSLLHKTRNYLIEIPDQRELEEDLITLEILTEEGSLAAGAPWGLLEGPEARRAFLRGAFMAGGFVADPRGDFHLEIAVAGEDYARDIARIAETFGVRARISQRRGSFVIYVKSFDAVMALLHAMGALRSAKAVSYIRGVKQEKSKVNRLTNADMANIRRASDAGLDQLRLVQEAERLLGESALPPALEEFCRLRLAHPELALSELGELCVPPASKSAMYHRLLRLRSLVEEASDA